MKRIAIIGSPNCGKTTLFNRLTGARQRTGNWPGVTVERKQGRFSVGDTSIELIDLPGIYSLEGEHAGIDAKVARDYLSTGDADRILLVIDATQMARQLRLLPQLLTLGQPLLIAVNMIDSARREHIDVNLAKLSKLTGVECVGISAATGEGINPLKTAIAKPQRPSLSDDFQPAHAKPIPLSLESIQSLCQEVCSTREQAGLTDKIDRWVLHPWLALPLFLLVMYLLFSISVNLGAVFIDFFDIWLGSWLVDGSRWLLTLAGSPEWLTTLLSDGLGGGIQLVCTFIPVIGCLYLCMSVLEDSGYLSRAAFVIDGMMSRIGLPGQAFIPLIVGFGCNVPSVMAARALDRPSARLTTIFIAPFMSCGARLSVYVFIGTAMFPERAGSAIFLLYLLGITVAIGSAWLLRKTLFHAESGSHIAEMPAYHKPLLRNVLTQTWQRLSGFMMRAGKRILAVVLVLSVISSVGVDGSWGNKDKENSLLASIGKSMTPALEPIGVGEDNWPATVGLFTGLFAKEVVVGTLDTLYSPVKHEATTDNEMPDFGAGFSQLERVMAIEPDIIKIDMGLFKQGAKGGMASHVVHLLTRLSKRTGCRIVCEGVETDDEFIFGLNCGAQFLQGYLFSPAEAEFKPELKYEKHISSLRNKFLTQTLKKQQLVISKIHTIKKLIIRLKKSLQSDFNLHELAAWGFEETGILRFYLCDNQGVQTSPNFNFSNKEWFTDNTKVGFNWSWRSYFYHLLALERAEVEDSNRFVISERYKDFDTDKTCKTMSIRLDKYRVLLVDISVEES